MLSKHERTNVLIEALPYIKRSLGHIIVVKYGGSVMLNDSLKQNVVDDIIFFSCIGLYPILVHGGGSKINFWLSKLHIEPIFRNGIRITNNVTMEVVEMVLTGKINKELVTLININGGNAVGLSGKDGSLILSQPLDIEKMGFVGNIVNVNTKILSLLISNFYIPVIASIGYDQHGQTYNINADLLASRIAVALNAEKLIFLTDMPGILLDINNLATVIQTLDVNEASQLEKKGIISGGMIPKVHSCVNALKHGVAFAYVIDGRVPHALLSTVLTKNYYGSMLLSRKTR
uniref:Acetylglutamate kinase n=1 Tax=Hildenbrandia rivularis TaxID=135206 RepID=A0A1C9CFK4_9FLOR|nr:acetylglutamate kinase [Hildenbrandia rivularis]AOM67178.1 acetylglutamate kinase [Hildenbrandia rivularis]